MEQLVAFMVIVGVFFLIKINIDYRRKRRSMTLKERKLDDEKSSFYY